MLSPVVGSAARVMVLCLVAVVLPCSCGALSVGAPASSGCSPLLGLVASPLAAFGVCSAAWHALRHTARLAADEHGGVRVEDLASTFAAGLPALVVTVALVAGGVISLHASASLGTWLWLGLALVWGLTVPHMIVVTRFDRARRPTGR